MTLKDYSKREEFWRGFIHIYTVSLQPNIQPSQTLVLEYQWLKHHVFEEHGH